MSGTISPELTQPRGRPARGFRLATFNVENLGDQTARAAGLDERVELLRPQLLRLCADILCLQEVDSQRPVGDEKARRLMALDRVIEETEYAEFHRLCTTSRTRGDPRDKHNLVILSRWPFVEQRQVMHDLVAPPVYYPATVAPPPTAAPISIEWDRPLLYAQVDLGNDCRLHVINVHLRAPRASFLPGMKTDQTTWRSMAGWAEGFFIASVKRAGQALEARLLIDRIFDTDPNALIIACGDFNADLHEVPVRTIRGDEEDAGNPHLSMRILVPLERSLPESLRYSVVHHGRPQMLDHVLVSRPMLAWYRAIEIHNEALGDELVTAHALRSSPESFHAPLVAQFAIAAGIGSAAQSA